MSLSAALALLGVASCVKRPRRLGLGLGLGLGFKVRVRVRVRVRVINLREEAEEIARDAARGQRRDERAERLGNG